MAGPPRTHVGIDFDHRSFNGTSTANPIQILNQDGTLAEKIDFIPGAPLAWIGQRSGRIHPGSLGDEFPLGGRLGSALFHREQWLGRSGRSARRLGVLSGRRRQDRDSSWNWFVLQFVATAGQRLRSQSYSSGDADRSRRNSEAARRSLTPMPMLAGKSPVCERIAEQHGTSPRNLTWNVQFEREVRNNVFLRVGYLDSHTHFFLPWIH